MTTGMPEPRQTRPKPAQRLLAGLAALPRWKQAALLVAAVVVLFLPLNAFRHYSATGLQSSKVPATPPPSFQVPTDRGYTESEKSMPVMPSAHMPEALPAPSAASKSHPEPAAPGSDEEAAAVQLASAAWDRLVIRNASLSLTVRDINDAQQRIVQIADLLGGYVAAANIQQPEKGAGQKPPATGTIELRVPNDRFNEALSELRKIGTQTAINITSQDISEEYVDLQSRLRHWRAQERLVLEMLDRASKISDMLSVRNSLNEIQQQIETITGRLRYLAARVSMASITVAICEKAPPAKPKKPTLMGKIKAEGKRLKAAFRKSVEDFVVVLAWLGVILVNVMWYALLAGAAYLVLRRFAPGRPTAAAHGKPPSAMQ